MYSHDPFQLLELDRRAATEADVKKAYATKLKKVRPEDDREGFMALRAAFEQARSIARWRDKNPEHAAEEDAWEDREAEREEAEAQGIESPDDSHFEEAGIADSSTSETDTDGDIDVTPEVQIFETGPKTDPVDVALEDIRQLANQPFAGGAFSPWREIIERDELQPIDEYQRLSEYLRGYICEEAGLYAEGDRHKLPNWLTLNVFNGLTSYFGWLNQPSNDYWVREQIDWLLKIEHHLNRPDADIEKDRKLKNKGHTPQGSYDSSRSGGPITDTSKPAQSQNSVGWWRILWVVIVAATILRVCADDSTSSGMSPEVRKILNERIDSGEFEISPSTQRALDRLNTNRALLNKQRELSEFLMLSIQDDGSYSEQAQEKIDTLKAEILLLEDKLAKLALFPGGSVPPTGED